MKESWNSNHLDAFGSNPSLHNIYVVRILFMGTGVLSVVVCQEITTNTFSLALDR